MAKIKLLVDTDILVDYLKGIRAARELFKTKEVDLSTVNGVANITR